MDDFIYLLSCGLNNQIPDKKRVEGMDFSALYKIASKHLLASMVGMVLESAGVKDERFKQVSAKAIRKNLLLDQARAVILKKFEEQGIWYMPLKGSVLKEYYPKYGMRQMSDNDILIDPSKMTDAREIMEGLGFTTEFFGGVHDVYHKEPIYNYELHRALFGEVHGKILFEYYRDVKNRLLKDQDAEYGYHFSPEDFYLYVTSHEYKHYSQSGTGVRSLVDTYVLMTKFGKEMDFAYIERETEKLGIAEFEKTSRSLALKLFGKEKNAQLTSEEREMLHYILGSGTYGNKVNAVNNGIAKNGGGRKGKIKYVMERVFVPISRKNPRYSVFRSVYPTFYKVPVLLPFLPAYRLIRVFTKNPKKLRTELRAVKKAKK